MLRTCYRPVERQPGNERQSPVADLAKDECPLFFAGRLGTDRSPVLERARGRFAEPEHQCRCRQHDEDEALIKKRVREYDAAREDLRGSGHDFPVEGQKEKIERSEHRCPDDEHSRGILVDEAPALTGSDRDRSSRAPEPIDISAIPIFLELGFEVADVSERAECCHKRTVSQAS